MKTHLPLIVLLCAACGARTATPNPPIGPEPEAPAPPPSAYADPFAPGPPAGFTGPVHEAHAGEVVFARTEIPAAPSPAFVFEDSAALTDPIFSRVFLRDSLQNLMLTDGFRCTHGYGYQLEVRVDGEPTDERIAYWAAGASDTTLLITGEHPVSLTEGPLFFPRDADDVRFHFANVIHGLAPGEHTLAFRVHAQCRGRARSGAEDSHHLELARGSLRVQVGDDDVAAYTQRVGPFLRRSSFPEDAAGCAAIGEHVVANWADSFVGCVTQEDEWRVRTHLHNGLPASRAISAAVVVRNAGSTTCQIAWDQFEQQAEGPRPLLHPERYRSIVPADAPRGPCANPQQAHDAPYCSHAAMRSSTSPPLRPFPCENAARDRHREARAASGNASP